MRARLVAAVTLTIALATRAGAAAAGIADIVTMPDAYVGRTVTVVGTAENPVPLGPASMFDLRDGRAKLTVMSPRNAPAAGSRLSVTGTIREAHVGDADENRDFPHVLVESARSAAP